MLQTDFLFLIIPYFYKSISSFILQKKFSTILDFISEMLF